MKLEQYRKEVTRTMPDLGSQLLNSLHMTVGIMTECGEITENFSEPSEYPLDRINLGEELADVMWYLANYANIFDIDFIDIDEEYTRNNYFGDEDHLLKLIQWGSILLDFDKKLLAYSKPINEDFRFETMNKIYHYIRLIMYVYSIDFEYTLERNIAKLKQRYPDKFDTDKAINRDTQAERAILEGKTKHVSIYF